MAYTVMFFVAALLTLTGSAVVAFSRSIIYSAFALLVSFIGVAMIYALLGADFLAVTQLMLYVGGILVLIMFAIMLTSKIGDAKISNRSISLSSAAILTGITAFCLTAGVIHAQWNVTTGDKFFPITHKIGESLLTTYLLPFEIISVLLLIGLIGAVIIARKEHLTVDENERRV